MYRKLTLEDYETKQKDILGIIQNPLLTHEQKVTELSRAAENLLTVLDEPEGIEKYMRCEDDERCICNLFSLIILVILPYIAPFISKCNSNFFNPLDFKCT